MSTTSKQSMASKLAIIFASTTLAVSIAVPARANTIWSCLLNSNSQYAGSVSIWWGHRTQDATWACNNWIPTCGNQGGCFARHISQRD